MIPVAIWLGAISLADLVGGLSGWVHSRIRACTAWAVAVLSAAGVAGGFGFPARTVVALTALVAMSAAAWIAVRRREDLSPRPAQLTLAAAGIAVGLLLATSGLWPEPRGGLAEEWFRSLDLPRNGIGSVERLARVVAAFLFVLATGNALVRILLAAVGAETSRAERRLRAGRIIGPLERSLILGFALAGEPTAAALVVSAKTLLRFPEVNASRDEPDIDQITEYLVVGSLASWLLAVAPVVLAG